jgi:hypothetical protein
MRCVNAPAEPAAQMTTMLVSAGVALAGAGALSALLLL